jgi:hypothetical protein
VPIIQPPPAPPKKVTVAVRFEAEKLAALRCYGAFIGTRNFSHIITESLDRVYKLDSQFKTWLKTHPDVAIDMKPHRNGSPRQSRKVAVTGATAPSIVVAAEAASITSTSEV